MKRIKYFIFTLLAASTIFVSCDLDRNPLDKFAENDFWTIKLITDLYINENNETYNHDVVQGNYFFVNTGICSL